MLTRQCLDRRVDDRDTLGREVHAWQLDRNRESRTIRWTFTRQEADRKLARRYVA